MPLNHYVPPEQEPLVGLWWTKNSPSKMETAFALLNRWAHHLLHLFDGHSHCGVLLEVVADSGLILKH